MANEDNFCLRENEFGSNIRKTWQQLQTDKDFCDVTLVCNDGQIQSHRIILSHSSPVLKDILKQNLKENPIIYLRSVKYKYLESLINFMYQGEVTVSDEDLENFLHVSGDLKVTGLSQKLENFHNNDDTSYFTEDNTECNNSTREFHSEDNHENDEHNTANSEYNRERRPESKHEDIGPSSKRKGTATCNQETNIIENNSMGLLAQFENFRNNDASNFLLQEPKTIRLDMAKDLKVPRLLPENRESITPSDELLENMDDVLAINENEELYGDMDEKQIQKYTNNGRDSLVIDNSLDHENDPSSKRKLKYEEPELNKEVTHLSNTKYNTQKVVSVKDRKLSCNTCDKQYTIPSNLRRHKASAHEGVRFSCEECNAGPFTQAGHLRTHKASVHEGVRYPCDECNAGPYTRATDLRKHKASAHEGVIYPCDECNAGPFTRAANLWNHKASVHEGVRYRCGECNAGPFKGSGYLRKHKTSVHEGVRYPCDECNAGPFTDSGNLWKHKASVHEGVRYECKTCDYKATTKWNLKMHCIKIHKI